MSRQNAEKRGRKSARAARRRILVVDDAEGIRTYLAHLLEAKGYDVDTAEDGRSALALLEGGAAPDAILLDIMMPGIDGFETCKRLKANENTKEIPVIFLTARTEIGAVIEGFDLGAIDYVTKPFKFSVLLARVRAHLRSFEQSEDATFQVGPYEFRPSMKLLVTEDGRKVRLTEKETNILKYLYRAQGKPVARDELLSEVWGYNATVTTHTLETHIYRLRQKVEPDPAHARLLLTDAGGYRLQP